MPRADLLTSIVLVAIGLGAAIESWRMPRLQHLGVSIYSAPGVVPFLLGLVIALLGLILLVRSLKGGGLTSGGPLVSGDGARRFAIAAVLTLGYAIILVGWLPFWAATAIFIAVFVLVFEWQAGIGGAGIGGAGIGGAGIGGAGIGGAGRAWRMTAVAGFALATGLGVSVLLEDVFLVRLP